MTKIPRFAFEKFPNADASLTTQMKSVGEVMAIGRSFQESFQKALRGLELGYDGLNEISLDKTLIIKELKEPGADRIRYLADGMRLGLSIEEIFNFTKIDPWFLYQIEDLIKNEEKLKTFKLDAIDKTYLFELKQKGFSDHRIGYLLGTEEKSIRELRAKNHIHPVYKRVDTCAAEFHTDTAYLYSTYEQECESRPTLNKKIIILGGGPNRIGQGIEFDYCCVHAAYSLSESGYETIMINCNPETVSTDYDTSDKLYFEPLTYEDVLSIIKKEDKNGEVLGVIVQLGGQTPLKIAASLEKAGVKILGTSVDAIDLAEDRKRFKELLQSLNLNQPLNGIATSNSEAIKIANEIGFPIVIRPSYVLGGRAMEIVHDHYQLQKYINEAVIVSGKNPVLIDSFLRDAIEVDVDALSDGKDIYLSLIHI